MALYRTIKRLVFSKDLSDLFSKELDKLGLIVNKGKIVDASFVESPRQRNGRAKNQQIIDKLNLQYVSYNSTYSSTNYENVRLNAYYGTHKIMIINNLNMIIQCKLKEA